MEGGNRKISTMLKKFFRRWGFSLLVTFIIILGAVVVALYKEEPETEASVEIETYSGDLENSIKLENERLVFELDPSTTFFSIKDKDSGTIWTSNPMKDGEMAAGNEAYGATLIAYNLDEKGVEESFSNYLDGGVSSGNYTIEQTDQKVRVTYYFGKLKKEYVFPFVITAKRLEELTASMEASIAKSLLRYYKKYEIEKMKPDSKEEDKTILERYPKVAEEPLYILRGDPNEVVMKRFEPHFLEAGYTIENLYEDNALDSQAVRTEQGKAYKAVMEYSLDKDGFVVEIPLDDISYPGKYPMSKLFVLPYLGAAGTEEEGYLMVPEGGGALIGFHHTSTSYTGSYNAPLYGWDMAKVRQTKVQEVGCSFGAFGILKTDASLLCVIDGFASNAYISASPTSKANPYANVNASYQIIFGEKYQLSRRVQNDHYIFEKGTDPGAVIRQKYFLVSSGDYSEMAKVYGEYCASKMPDRKASPGVTPFMAEFIGAVDETKHVFGIPTVFPEALTTFQDMKDIVSNLQEIPGLSVKLTGWANEGVRQKVLNKIVPVSELGGEKNLKDFLAYTKQSGIGTYLNGITDYSIDSGFLDGFSMSKDTSRFLNKRRAILRPYHPITYRQARSGAFYLLDVANRLTMMDNLSQYCVKYGTGISYDNVGSVLSADFAESKTMSREQVKKSELEELQKAYGQGADMVFNRGYDFVLPYATLITNMDLKGKTFDFFDYQIPFYQMAIHDKVNYSSAAINMMSNPETAILQSAEYGAGLSYALTQTGVSHLQNTDYSVYHATRYSSIRKDMMTVYNRYNAELQHTFGQKMTGHSYKTKDITCTEYEDGTRVYVNYGYSDETVDGQVIPCRNYKVVK